MNKMNGWASVWPKFYEHKVFLCFLLLHVHMKAQRKHEHIQK